MKTTKYDLYFLLEETLLSAETKEHTAKHFSMEKAKPWMNCGKAHSVFNSEYGLKRVQDEIIDWAQSINGEKLYVDILNQRERFHDYMIEIPTTTVCGTTYGTRRGDVDDNIIVAILNVKAFKYCGNWKYELRIRTIHSTHHRAA